MKKLNYFPWDTVKCTPSAKHQVDLIEWLFVDINFFQSIYSSVSFFAHKNALHCREVDLCNAIICTESMSMWFLGPCALDINNDLLQISLFHRILIDIHVQHGKWNSMAIELNVRCHFSIQNKELNIEVSSVRWLLSLVLCVY